MAEALVAAGAQPQWVSQLAAIGRVAPLNEEAVTRMVGWVDFSRVDRPSDEPNRTHGRGVC
jgi:hypothetical protein